jgi:hypothetical protein
LSGPGLNYICRSRQTSPRPTPAGAPVFRGRARGGFGPADRRRNDCWPVSDPALSLPPGARFGPPPRTRFDAIFSPSGPGGRPVRSEAFLSDPGESFFQSCRSGLGLTTSEFANRQARACGEQKSQFSNLAPTSDNVSYVRFETQIRREIRSFPESHSRVMTLPE